MESFDMHSVLQGWYLDREIFNQSIYGNRWITLQLR